MKNRMFMPSIVIVCATGLLATCLGVIDWDMESEDDELALLDAETDCFYGEGDLDVCYSLDEYNGQDSGTKDAGSEDGSDVDGDSADGSDVDGDSADGSDVDGGSADGDSADGGGNDAGGPDGNDGVGPGGHDGPGGGHHGHDSEAVKACKKASKKCRKDCNADAPFKVALEECHDTYKTCVETSPADRKRCKKEFRKCRKDVMAGVSDEDKKALHDCMHGCRDTMHDCIHNLPKP